MKNPFQRRHVPESFPVEAEALFFLSTGRTGTTTVARAMETLHEVVSHHEAKPMLYDSRYHIFQEQRLDAAWVEADFKLKRSVLIADAAKQGKCYVESSAFLSYHTPAIAELMPHAKFVFMHRNPYDFVRSGMRRDWYCGHKNDPVRLVPQYGTEEARLWQEWGQFEKVCWLWSAFNGYCMTCFERLPDGRKLKIPSEFLWAEPRSCAERILKLVNREQYMSDVIVEQMTVKHNAQQKNEYPLPDEWTDQQRQALVEICGSVMKALGYEAVL